MRAALGTSSGPGVAAWVGESMRASLRARFRGSRAPAEGRPPGSFRAPRVSSGGALRTRPRARRSSAARPAERQLGGVVEALGDVAGADVAEHVGKVVLGIQLEEH